MQYRAPRTAVKTRTSLRMPQHFRSQAVWGAGYHVRARVYVYLCMRASVAITALALEGPL